jgi:hypothetical protein
VTTPTLTQQPWPWLPWVIGGLIGLVFGPVAVFNALGMFTSGQNIVFGVLITLATVAVWAVLFRYRRTIALGALIGTVIGCVVWFAVTFYFFSQLARGTDFNPTAENFTKQIGLELPSGVQNIQMNEVSWQDTYVQARFEMPKTQLESFIKTNKLRLEENPTETLKNTTLDRAWWTPEESKRLGTYRLKDDPAKPNQEASTKTQYYVLVQVHELDADRVLVYLRAYET